jgi:glutamate/tyrosine decarboxylase-like PLP-dependent enzyme
MTKIKNITSNFLEPNERNFDILLNKQKKLHKILLKSTNYTGSPRMIIDAAFKYKERLVEEFIPESGLNENDLYNKISEAFEGVIKFHHTHTLFNITPPTLFDAIAVSSITNLYNPNVLWDINSGKMVLFEKIVVKYLCDLAGFDNETSSGVSCFGGKATFMYAIKQGIENVNRNTKEEGIRDEYVVITSKVCHYTLESVCNFLGLGSKACVRVACDKNENICIDALEKQLRKSVSEGKKIACIVLSGGSTLDLSIDNINEVIKIRDEVCREFNLTYIPHVHFDSVIGWAWLFYKDYDFVKNSLKIKERVLKKIMSTSNKIKGVSLADSFGVDFHKMGFCPYSSSFFISKKNLGDKNIFDKSYGDEQVYTYTMENSRSGTGILSSWVSINSLGIEGFRKYIAYSMEISEYLRNKIENEYPEEFQILNDFSEGVCIMLKPHYKNQKTDFYKLLHQNEKRKGDYNIYCEKFYKYVFYNICTKKNKYPLIGFLSNYRKRTIGSDLSAIRLFPVSLFLDNKMCDELLKDLIKMKKEFEQFYLNRDTLDNISIHDHQPR